MSSGSMIDLAAEEPAAPFQQDSLLRLKNTGRLASTAGEELVNESSRAKAWPAIPARYPVVSTGSNVMSCRRMPGWRTSWQFPELMGHIAFVQILYCTPVPFAFAFPPASKSTTWWHGEKIHCYFA